MQLGLLPFLVAIMQESSKQTGVQVVQNCCQEIFVELKCVGELVRHLGRVQGGIEERIIAIKFPNLPDTVDPLKEDWAPLFIVVFVITVANTLAKLVAEAQPFFLYQNLQAHIIIINIIITHR